MLFIQARGTVGFIFNEINKWKFMQFSVMNFSGFDFNIVSICLKNIHKMKAMKTLFMNFQ
jgi:hypothetical protein